jgi:hypothetical protein
MDIPVLLITCAGTAVVLYWVVWRPQRHPKSLHERKWPDRRRRPF